MMRGSDIKIGKMLVDPQQARTAETFDKYKDDYSQSVDKSIAFSGLKTDFFTKVKSDYIIDTTNSVLGGSSNLDVLDIGCGVGNYHQLLSPQFRSLVGVDVSAACVETARSRNPSVRYEVYGGEVLPFDDASFDFAFTICVMHHVPPAHWPQFVMEMHRVLKPGGLALVFEHNPQNRLTMRAVNNCPFDAEAVLLPSETTAKLLGDAGFTAVSSRYILTIPPFNGLMRRIDGLLSGLSLGAQYYVQCRK